jgi:hypothetical protein
LAMADAFVPAFHVHEQGKFHLAYLGSFVDGRSIAGLVPGLSAGRCRVLSLPEAYREYDCSADGLLVYHNMEYPQNISLRHFACIRQGRRA